MSSEFRKRERREIDSDIRVTDTMTSAVVGRIGNLSETGMLLIASARLREDALYQFRFELPGANASVEVGAHLLWNDEKDAPGTSWAGFRFIGVSEDAARRLRNWIENGRA